MRAFKTLLMALPLLSAFLLPVFSFSANAAEMTWEFRGRTDSVVNFQLYSETRPGHQWPNATEAWRVDDYSWHSYPISCQYNEKICYGAWVKNNTNRYWGTGYNGTQGCEDCCARCDGSTFRINLDD